MLTTTRPMSMLDGALLSFVLMMAQMVLLDP